MVAHAPLKTITNSLKSNLKMSSNKKRLTEQDVHMESSSSDSSDEEGQHPEAYTGNEVSLKKNFFFKDFF